MKYNFLEEENLESEQKIRLKVLFSLIIEEELLLFLMKQKDL